MRGRLPSDDSFVSVMVIKISWTHGPVSKRFLAIAEKARREHRRRTSYRKEEDHYYCSQCD